MQGSVIVSAGDSTSSLADRLGVSNRELIEANPHKEYRPWGDGRLIFVDLIEGEPLRIPRRVAHQFPLQALPSLGAALPQLGSILPSAAGPSAGSGCKPGEVQLAPGVCVPNATAPSPQGGCPTGTMELMGQCVPDPRSSGKAPPTASGCPEGQILLAGQCFPDPRNNGSKGTPLGCPPGTMDVGGQCFPVPPGGVPAPSAGGCPPGMISFMGQCVPDPKGIPGTPPPTSPECPPGSISLSGQCFPDPRSQFPGTPPASQQGGCPENTYPLYPGLCVPLGTEGGSQGQGPVPCPAGTQELSPGLCIPHGVPTGNQQGGCGPGRREILPGVCVPDLESSGGVPAGNVPPTPEQCFQEYGAGYFPYRDPVSKAWGCGACPTAQEVPAADGLCYCKQGTVRQDPMDPNSPCVPSSSGPDQPSGFVPENQKDRDALCHQVYGFNSKSVLVDGEWVCNVCRADEEISADGYCICLKGTSRSVDGDPDSACLPTPGPEQPSKEKEEKKDNTGLIIVGVATGALLLLGVGILAGRTSSPPPPPPPPPPPARPARSPRPPQKEEEEATRQMRRAVLGSFPWCTSSR